MKLISRTALLAMAVFALGGIGNPASADQYPAKPIRFVAPYPPGSVTDLLARVIAQKLTEKRAQPVIVENRGRGGSVIGTDLVAKAPPDGYSISMVAPDLAINVRPQIPSGKLRVLAVATATRAQAMPNLPTVAEAGCCSSCFQFRYAFQLLCNRALGQLQVVGRLKI